MDKEVNASDEDSKEEDDQEIFNGKNKPEDVHFSNSVENKTSKKERIIQKIMDMNRERRTLLSENVRLQRLLSDLFRGPLGQDFIQENKMTQSDDEQTFFNLLNVIDAKLEERQAFELNSSKEIDSTKNEMMATEKKYKELNSEFKSIKEKTALQSVNSNTGEKFTKKEVSELLWKEQEAEEKLHCYQLEYLRKKQDLEEAVQKKQNLVERPVDYAEYDVICTEIENNKEVTKQLEEETEELQKKMFSMINAISHLKQKLQFVQYQNGIAEEKEKSLEEELNKKRDNLFTEKVKFNKMKDKNEDLRHRFILLQHPKLIEDYKNLKVENENAQKQLQQLKDTYANSMKIVSELQK